MRMLGTGLAFAVIAAGCTLPPATVVPVAQDPLPLVSLGEPQVPSCPLDRIEVTLLPSLHEPRAWPAPPVGRQKGSGGTHTPISVVMQAQQFARLEPTVGGYQGGSGEHTYRWAPGKVFTVYLSKTHGTGIFLPPGEQLVSGLYLDGESFDVKTERAGTGERAYDAIIVRPLTDAGEVDTIMLTASGKRYLLHLVIGRIGMLAVTFTPDVGA